MLNIIKGTNYKIFSTILFVVLFFAFFLPTNVYANTVTEPTLTELLNKINSSLINVGVETNLLCYFSNPTVCTSLYFEGKIINGDTRPEGIKVGKIEFLNPIDLTNSDVQDFLTNLYTLITFTNGTVGINMNDYATLIGNSTGLNFAAKITMYGIETSITPKIIVSDYEKNGFPFIDSSKIFYYKDSGIFSFETNHFTTFSAVEPNPDLKSIDIAISYPTISIGTTLEGNDKTLTKREGGIIQYENLKVMMNKPVIFANPSVAEENISIEGIFNYGEDKKILNFGTFTIGGVNLDQLVITPNEGFEVLKFGKFIIKIDQGLLKDNFKNLNNDLLLNINIFDDTIPTIEINDDNINKTKTNTNIPFDVCATMNDEGVITPKCHTVSINATYTFNGKDKGNNDALPKSFTVWNFDDKAPVIILKGANPQIIEFGNTYTELGVESIKDNYDTNDAISNLKIDISDIPVISNINLTTTQVGSYVVNYTTHDTYGNETKVERIIEVVDRTIPSININGNSSVTVYQGSTYTDLGATAIDLVDGDISLNIIKGGTYINTNTIGQYTITYNVSDNEENPANEKIRTINVVQAPSSSSGSFITPRIINTPITTTPTQESTSGQVGEVLGAESYNFTKFMKFNSRGLEVIELQKFLNQAGFNSGKVDGIFGPITKAALIKFQLENNLKGDGIVGPLTRAVLNK